MAIYSFNHDTFGKSATRTRGNTPYAAARNAAYNAREDATRLDGQLQDGTAGSNAAYNVRSEVTYAARSHGMPTEPEAVEAWFREQERGDRKNARMSDRFIGALPRELTPDQCLAVVERFCRDVTGDRIPWHFGLHLELEHKADADWNPHAHVIFRDRDIETGKRHLNTSSGQRQRQEYEAKGVKCWSTADFRAAWQDHLNIELERNGHEVRVDARSYKDRGIEQEPGVHHGRAAQRLTEKGERPLSNSDYIHIDNGQTRLEENERRKRRRSERPPPDTPEQRARQQLNQLHGQQRSDLAAQQHAEAMALRALHKAEFASRTHQEKLHNRESRNAAYADIGQQFSERYQQVRGIGDPRAREAALGDLTQQQAAAYDARSAELIANAAPAKDARWRQMKATQAGERHELDQHQATERDALKLAQDSERLALKEQLRANREAPMQVQRDSRQALRDAVALTGNQSMVNVEAVQMERMRRRAEKASGQVNASDMAQSHKAVAENWRERAARLRAEAEAHKETTDRRLALEEKAQQQPENLSPATKQKGKGDRDQER